MTSPHTSHPDPDEAPGGPDPAAVVRVEPPARGDAKAVSALHPEHVAWRSLDGWLTENPPPRRWLLDDGQGSGVLEAGIVAMLAAPGGTGKSYALAQLAVAVATGRPWLGRFRVVDGPRPVLAYFAEEGRIGTWNRLVAAREAAGVEHRDRAAMELLRANLHAVPVRGHTVRLTERDGRLAPQAGDLAKAIQAYRPGLVILDPISKFAGGDHERESDAANRFVEALEEIAGTGDDGPTVMIAHHARKDTAQANGNGRSEPRLTAALARGSGGLVDAPRWLMVMAPASEDGSGDVRARIAKANDIEPELYREFTLRHMGGSAAGCFECTETPARTRSVEAAGAREQSTGRSFYRLGGDAA